MPESAARDVGAAAPRPERPRAPARERRRRARRTAAHRRRADPALPRLAAVVERRHHGRAAVGCGIRAQQRSGSSEVAATHGDARRRPRPEDYGDPVVDATRVRQRRGVRGACTCPGSARTRSARIAEGTGLDVLNSFDLGVGHYPDTQMPGEVGNFAIASHRSAYGGGMHEIEQLQLGDAIYIQTHDGWYTYRFRDFEIRRRRGCDHAPVAHDAMAARRLGTWPTASSTTRGTREVAHRGDTLLATCSLIRHPVAPDSRPSCSARGSAPPHEDALGARRRASRRAPRRSAAVADDRDFCAPSATRGRAGAVAGAVDVGEGEQGGVERRVGRRRAPSRGCRRPAARAPPRPCCCRSRCRPG